MTRSARPASTTGSTHSRKVPNSAGSLFGSESSSMIIFEVGLRKHVSRIGKCRHPLSVALQGVPADVIVMQMRAHDVDRSRPAAHPPRQAARDQGMLSMFQNGRAGLILLLPQQPSIRIVLATDLHEPAVDAELYEAAGRIIVARRQPSGVLGEDVVVEFGKNVRGHDRSGHRSPRCGRCVALPTVNTVMGLLRLL